jgi:hypothetical protein
LLQKKGKSEGKIVSYVKELQNHLHITPAILHTDCRGEFSSIFLKYFLSENGIILEQGPTNSPQTNGLAERFNQIILVKMRCMLAQLAVPLNYWDKAAWFASTLIIILPLSSLNWRSPNLVLCNSDKSIEQVRKVQTLLSFGLKVYLQCPEDENHDISHFPFWACKPNCEITARPTNKTIIHIAILGSIPNFFS